MILIAIYGTVRTMSKHYFDNIVNWVKTAVWDAPRRVYLDVQLEYMRIERYISMEEEMKLEEK